VVVNQANLPPILLPELDLHEAFFSLLPETGLSDNPLFKSFLFHPLSSILLLLLPLFQFLVMMRWQMWLRLLKDRFPNYIGLGEALVDQVRVPFLMAVVMSMLHLIRLVVRLPFAHVGLMLIHF
jgi:hypothetical protein